MSIIAITVSTKYARKLDYIAKTNHVFFKEWYIITEESDNETREVCKKYPNMTVLFYNFRNGYSIFDKGGALQMAQKIAHSKYPTDFILILDSDILLPANFDQLVNVSKLDKDVFYGVNERKDYISQVDLESNRGGLIYKHTPNFVGFFNLYYIKSNTYRPSYTCSHCDCKFAEAFTKKVQLSNVNVKHLGREGVNWEGIKAEDFRWSN